MILYLNRPYAVGNALDDAPCEPGLASGERGGGVDSTGANGGE